MLRPALISTAVGADMLLMVSTSQYDWRPLASCFAGLRGAAMSRLLLGGLLALGGVRRVGRLSGRVRGADSHAVRVGVGLRDVHGDAGLGLLRHARLLRSELVGEGHGQDALVVGVTEGR